MYSGRHEHEVEEEEEEWEGFGEEYVDYDNLSDSEDEEDEGEDAPIEPPPDNSTKPVFYTGVARTAARPCSNPVPVADPPSPPPANCSRTPGRRKRAGLGYEAPPMSTTPHTDPTPFNIDPTETESAVDAEEVGFGVYRFDEDGGGFEQVGYGQPKDSVQALVRMAEFEEEDVSWLEDAVEEEDAPSWGTVFTPEEANWSSGVRNPMFGFQPGFGNFMEKDHGQSSMADPVPAAPPCPHCPWVGDCHTCGQQFRVPLPPGPRGKTGSRPAAAAPRPGVAVPPPDTYEKAKKKFKHICTFWQKGQCKHGDECRFKHEYPANNLKTPGSKLELPTEEQLQLLRLQNSLNEVKKMEEAVKKREEDRPKVLTGPNAIEVMRLLTSLHSGCSCRLHGVGVQRFICKYN